MNEHTENNPDFTHPGEEDGYPQKAVRQGEDNEQLIQNALAQYNSRTLSLLGNRSQRNLVQEKLMAELALGFDHRRQALSMVLESRLHSVREACNHILTTGKTHLRQQRLAYFGQIFHQVEQHLNTLADEFLEDMDKRFEKIEKYQNHSIREREQARMERSLDGFMDTLDCLMSDFRNIIHENISQPTIELKSTDDSGSASAQRPLMDQLIGSQRSS